MLVRERCVDRFERATEAAVKNLTQRMLPLQELADAIRTCLNNMVRVFVMGALRSFDV